MITREPRAPGLRGGAGDEEHPGRVRLHVRLQGQGPLEPLEPLEPFPKDLRFLRLHLLCHPEHGLSPAGRVQDTQAILTLV